MEVGDGAGEVVEWRLVGWMDWRPPPPCNVDNSDGVEIVILFPLDVRKGEKGEKTGHDYLRSQRTEEEAEETPQQQKGKMCIFFEEISESSLGI